MLTSLYVEKPQSRSKVVNSLRKMRRDKISTQIKQSGGISVKCVEYVSYSGRVNYKRLDRIIGAQRNRLLCDKEILLPKNMGYKRFDDRGYKERLCTNLGIALLKTQENTSLSVGIIDKNAHYTTLPQDVLRYTDNVIVVSERFDIYKSVSEQLIEETGAVIRLSKNIGSLSECDIIIAPCGTEGMKAVSDKTLVLTTGDICDISGGIVVYDYTVKLPQMLSALCPKGIDGTYFLGALYSYLGVFELGSFVPRLCITKNGVHTTASLKTLLLNKGSKNLT